MITGGAGGLGFLIAKQVLRHQTKKLIIWDIDSKKLDITADKLQTFENKVLTYKVDVSKPDHIYRTAQKVFNITSYFANWLDNPLYNGKFNWLKKLSRFL